MATLAAELRAEDWNIPGHDRRQRLPRRPDTLAVHAAASLKIRLVAARGKRCLGGDAKTQDGKKRQRMGRFSPSARAPNERQFRSLACTSCARSALLARPSIRIQDGLSGLFSSVTGWWFIFDP